MRRSGRSDRTMGTNLARVGNPAIEIDTPFRAPG